MERSHILGKMPINPDGVVVLWDGESPRTFTGRARTVISGGEFVVVSGAANVVSSGADSFVTSDIVVDILNDSDYCNGIALNNVGSNGLVTVATRGTFISRCAGIISGGLPVIPFSGTLQGVLAGHTTIDYSGNVIGRSITAAASGPNNYLLLSLNL